MTPFPKPEYFRSKVYLDWLRKQMPICVGFGATETHHLKILNGGGTGIKPPDNHCVPVPWSVHKDIHQRGEKQVLLIDAGFTVEELRTMADRFFDRWRRSR